MATAMLLGGTAVAANLDDPLVLTPVFAATSEPIWSTRGAATANSGACAVHITDIRDLRWHVPAAGKLSGRAVEVEQVAPWIRQALSSIFSDSRLRFDYRRDQADPTDIVVEVEVLKVYLASLDIDKTADVVLRIRYRRGGVVLGEQIYRGAYASLQFSDGADEAMDALNHAMTIARDTVHRDILYECSSGPPAASGAR